MSRGHPHFFRCPVARRSSANYGHEVTLTGRKKSNPSRNARGRMTQILREYECSCGHVGWSAHQDLAR